MAKTPNQHRINREITAPSVRVVADEEDGFTGGIYTLQKALQMAEDAGKDLVEVASSAVPPVCRIIEYSKFKYELKKKEKESKNKQHIVLVKEVRFSPNTDTHDFNFKVRHAQNFLEEGHKVKCCVVFHGRSMKYTEKGTELLNAFAAELEAVAKVEMSPRMEGRRMYMMLIKK